MEIYLLKIQRRPTTFAAGSEPEPAPGPDEPASGLRGRLIGTYKRLQDSLNKPGPGIGPRLKRFWDWLHERLTPDEPVLFQLRTAESLTIHYPSSLSPKLARKRWKGYLSRRQRSQIFWGLFNLMISPVTVLLAPLPGPNIIGYWFAYRAICHLLMFLGIRRAKRKRMALSFCASEVLDALPGEEPAEYTLRVAESLGLKNRDAYLEHWAKPSHHAAGSKAR
jgi:K+-H+ exchange-related protein